MKLYDKNIGLTSVPNARQLGGYITTDGRTVKDGLLLRTAHLYNLSDEDKQKLEKVYKVGDVVDFRLDVEADGSPDRQLEDCRHHHFDVYELPVNALDDLPVITPDPKQFYAATKALKLLDDDLYIRVFESEKGIKGYRNFLKVLISAEEGRATIFHCTSGKDRTGMAAMLILSLLGVSEQTILYDFILSNDYFEDKRANTMAVLDSIGADEKMKREYPLLMDAVSFDFLANLLKHLIKTYGSVTAYAKTRLEITDDEIQVLKNKYLD